MINTTYIHITRAAELLETDEHTLLIAATEGRMRLYGLLNQFRMAIKEKQNGLQWETVEEQHKYIDFFPLEREACAQMLCTGHTGKIRVVSEPDENGLCWTLGKPSAVDYDIDGGQVTEARLQLNLIFAKRSDIEDIRMKKAPQPGTVPHVATSRSAVPRDNSLMIIICALLSQHPGKAFPSGKDLEKAAQSLGLSISDDTIRKALIAAHHMAPSLPLPLPS